MGFFDDMFEESDFEDGFEDEHKVITTLDVQDKETFIRKMEKMVEARGDDNILYAGKFYGSVMNIARDLYDFVQDFQTNMSETYSKPVFEHREMKKRSVDAADYGSKDYSFERLSKAKLSCKAAVERMCADVREDMETMKKQQLDAAGLSAQKWLDEIQKDVEKFIDVFQDSFIDYIELYCDDDTKESVEKMRNDLFSKSSLLEEWNALELRGRIESLVREEFDIDFSLEPQSYFEMCTYEKGENGLYCYDMEKAVGRLNEIELNSPAVIQYITVDGVTRSRKKEEGQEITELENACLKFTVRIKQLLISMLTWKKSK